MKNRNITILHGGIQNKIKLNSSTKKKYLERLLWIRTLNENGDPEKLDISGVKPFDETEENPDLSLKSASTRVMHLQHSGSICWDELYDGNQGFIVYGPASDSKKNKIRNRH